MKRWLPLLCLILPVNSWALSSIPKGPIVANIEHAGFNLTWTSDVLAQARWGWDTFSHAVSTSSTNYANHWTSNNQHIIQGQYVYGLLANTTYFIRACAWDGATTEVCAPEISTHTPNLPAVHPALPIPPTPVDNTFPTCANGRLNCSGNIPVSHVIGPNCDDGSTGLVATFNSAAWGDTIVIPTTTTCQGYYKFSKGSWDGIHRMVVESGNVASLPAVGVRVSTNDAVNMPTFYESFWPHPGASADDRSHCYPGGFAWDTSSGNPGTPGWNMRYCGQTGSTGTVSGVINYVNGIQTVSYTFNLSVPLSTATVGMWGYAHNVGGIPRANGSFQITAVGSVSSFTATMYNNYISTVVPTYTSGGTVVVFDWFTVLHDTYTGVAPTDNCSPGIGLASSFTWTYSNLNPSGGALTGNISNSGRYDDQNFSAGRVWRCTAPNVWSPHYIVNDQNKETSNPITSVIDLSAAQHIWVIGLNIGAQPSFLDPLLYRSGQTLTGGGDADTQGGDNPDEYINTTSGLTGSSDIVIDRCILTRYWPLKGDLLVQMDGQNLILQNSYLKSTGVNWWGHEDRGEAYDNSAGEFIAASFANGALLYNNYLEHYGITVHFLDSSIGYGVPGSAHDITVQRNYFYRNLALIDEAPGSTVDYYTPLRQLLEFKTGMRVDINGNTFQNNFQNVSQAAAIALSNYSGGSGNLFSLSWSVTVSTATLNPASNRPYTINPGDWIADYVDGINDIYQVVGTSPSVNQVFIANLPSSPFSGMGTMWISEAGTGTDGMSDINIRNNIFLGMPAIFGNFAHITHEERPFRVGQNRLRFTNNIIKNLGNGGDGTGSLKLPIQEGWFDYPVGDYVSAWNVWGGQEDWTMDHNTFYQINPNLDAPSFGTIYKFNNNNFPAIDIADSEGIVFKNNMEWTHALSDAFSLNSVSGFTCPGGPFTGIQNAQCFTRGDLPFQFTKNVSAFPLGYPGGYDTTANFWPIYTSTTPFVNTATNNFQITSGAYGSSTFQCFANPGDCTTDGTDSGVNMAQLLAAQNGTTTGFTGSQQWQGAVKLKGGVTLH